jgi:hypothetical protein
VTGWIWLDTTYACGGVEVHDGTIVRTCPIYGWMRGKAWTTMLASLQRSGKYRAHGHTGGGGGGEMNADG